LLGEGSEPPLNGIPCLKVEEQRIGGMVWLSLSHQGRNHLIQYHHIFPKSRLPKLGYEKAEINEIANMAFISAKENRDISNKPPSDYFPRIIGERGASALAAQLIPEDPALWRLEAFREFLAARRELLAEAVNGMLAPS
jgi:hypothetical protein